MQPSILNKLVIKWTVDYGELNQIIAIVIVCILFIYTQMRTIVVSIEFNVFYIV